MTKNTKLRVFSSIFLLALIVTVFSMGKYSSLLLFFLVGFLINDELITNFFKLKRFSTQYNMSQIIFLLYFVVYQIFHFSLINIVLGIVANILLLLFLFRSKKSGFILFFKPIPVAIYLACCLSVWSYLVVYSNWLLYILFPALICVSTDVMAWVFGKNFGKRKLWESVSPKKTVEGAIGGVLSTVIICSLFYFIFSTLNFYHPIVILFLSVISIVGDLVQSKLKRSYKLKDSSSLIPGHGGVYDRLDSHLFVAPVYQLLVYLNIIIF